MSERPVAVTRTDEILLHLVDRVEHLIGHLEDRDGAPAQPADAPTDPAPEPEPKRAPAKKTSSKAKAVDVDGR